MSNLAKKDDQAGMAEYIPFGSTSAIRLSAAMVSQFIAVPTRSGKLPSERDCIRFVALCKAKGLNPFESDAFLIGYDGQDGPTFSLITAHQAFLKRAELNPEYNGMESGVSVIVNGELVERQGDFTFEGENLVGAWARVHFKTRSVPMFKRIKRETFDTGKSRWKVDPAGMLVKCAEADALRSSFPTMLGGLYVEQELHRVQAEGDKWEPIAMPVALPPPTEGALPPSQEPPAAREDAPASTKGADPGSWVEGYIEEVAEKSGQKGTKKWTRFGVKVAGVYYNTFDTKLGELAQSLQKDNLPALISFKMDGRYHTIVDIGTRGPDDQAPPDDGPVTDGDGNPIP